MILDVGCGDRAKGDINIDSKVQTRLWQDKNYAIHNFILADAANLPFLDNTFNLVLASHLLEHCLEPIQVLREFYRVSKFISIIKVPSALHHRDEEKQHYFSWTPNSLNHLCNQVFDMTKLFSTRYSLRKTLIPTRRLFRLVPILALVFKCLFEKWRYMVYSPEITIICYKKKEN